MGAPAPVAPFKIPPSEKATNIAVIINGSENKINKLYNFKINFPKCLLSLI